MRRFLVGFLATVGALTLLLVIGVGVAIWLFVPRAPELPERIVLTLDLRDALPEVTGDDPLSALGLERELTLPQAVLALERAVDDERVRALVVRLDGGGPGFAQAQELRDAVARLREAGKLTIAHADSFGELGPGTRGFYLASAFDEIHLQPLGALGLTGVLIEVPLLRGLLENLGVEPAVAKRGQYKTAADVFTDRDMTRTHREALATLADSFATQIKAGIGTGRDLEENEVAELVDSGPFAAEEAAEAGLVDGLSYRDQVLERATGHAGAGSRRIPLAAYALALEPPEAFAGRIALVHGVGQIQRGESRSGPATGWIMGADSIAKALADAIDDPGIEAILFRIDSPGGSAVASETIGREVRRAVEAGKPVIVSMADVAASGGYWIAMDASTIVAAPGTITGSIGVFAGKPVLAELWDEIGVNWGRIERGENAAMWSPNVDYSAQGRARRDAFLDHIYAAFTEGVARGRGLSEQQIEEAAQGRVWTGAQAQELGLVDRLGGFRDAVMVAKEAIGVGPDEPVLLQRFPAPRPPWQRALEMVRDPILELQALGAWLRILDPGVLSAPPIAVR